MPTTCAGSALPTGVTAGRPAGAKLEAALNGGTLDVDDPSHELQRIPTEELATYDFDMMDSLLEQEGGMPVGEASMLPTAAVAEASTLASARGEDVFPPIASLSVPIPSQGQGGASKPTSPKPPRKRIAVSTQEVSNWFLDQSNQADHESDTGES